jgi:(1->4)-alpha-D-glucan 1-alpha-D-glucosylmutase
VSQCLDQLGAEKTAKIPLSTYRLQFNKDFRFQHARELVPYLRSLGISHCYASPILKARAGSPHGYDISDHNEMNPEIGSEQEFRALVAELKANGLGLILDTVPNHMGIGPGSNPWWQDILQNGRASAYADFFDIDWQPLKEELRGKVLIPILGSTYGEELEQGHIRVNFQDGRFFVSYFDNLMPLDPQAVPMIFAAFIEPGGEADEELAEFRALLGDMRQLPQSSSTDEDLISWRQRELPGIFSRLQEIASKPVVAAFIQRAIAEVNGRPGIARSYDRLHDVLEAQPYRLAFWRVSGEEINYRRFFDINDLVGLRMEDPRVFAETHRLIRRLLGEGFVSGLRIDHPDGLLNPVQYFTRLQMLYVASRCCGPEPSGPVGENGIEVEVQNAFAQGNGEPDPMYLLAEKILERGETLPRWAVDGTVGYDFANLVNGILIDTRNERYFTHLYERIVGGPTDPNEIIYQSKKNIMYSALASEVNVLTHLLDQISMRDRRARDFTRSVLRNTIREAIASFPVYRTYIDERGNIPESDRHYIEQAISAAKRRSPEIAPAFDFLRSVLLLEGGQDGESIYGYSKQLYFTLKFQQLTGPVMAKGLEDTTCYVYNRFVAVNEVGGSPAEFGISVDEFHRGNRLRAEQWPHSMLATSTHDTKRSEDVRARLDVLSEMPRHWSAHVMKWRRMNRAKKVQIPDGRVVPDNNEEYLLYQTIVGAMPMRFEAAAEREQFASRIQQYMLKAAHEAKVNVSWLNPNPDYVNALTEFVARILSPEWRGKPNQFLESLYKFMPPVKFFGAMNSLTQTLAKLTAPGVPDVYQGQELWDFSLVDPDNRRPVDFGLRRSALHALQSKQDGNRTALSRTLLHEYQRGDIKLWLTAMVLNFRQQHAGLFSAGEYLPLRAHGSREENVVAYARVHGEDVAIVAAPRLAYSMMKGSEQAPIGSVWGDTTLTLPPQLGGRELRNVFTGEIKPAGNGNSLLCRDLFAHLPFALLAA